MEGKQKRESFRKKAGLLAHHLRPAASAFALGIGASLAATLLRTLFTQIIRFTVDHALLGETDGLPAFLLDAPAGRILVWCAAAAATVALLEFGAGRKQKTDAIDPAVGLVMDVRIGDFVKQGDALATLHLNRMELAEGAIARMQQAVRLTSEKPATPPLVYAAVSPEGVAR